MLIRALNWTTKKVFNATVRATNFFGGILGVHPNVSVEYLEWILEDVDHTSALEQKLDVLEDQFLRLLDDFAVYQSFAKAAENGILTTISDGYTHPQMCPFSLLLLQIPILSLSCLAMVNRQVMGMKTVSSYNNALENYLAYQRISH